jgi:uncharacterized delta-60 repeat protein
MPSPTTSTHAEEAIMQRKKNRKAGRGRGPLIRLVGLNAAVATVGLAGTPAQAAPGDLDPAFGDVGRNADLQPYYWTSLQSSGVAADDSVLFGGGGEYCYFGCYEDFFVGALLPDGTIDSGFVRPQLAKTVVRDTALQSDGKFVAVGRARAADGTLGLSVFRMLRNGALDTSFGIGGLTTISSGTATEVEGHAVVIDPDDRIVVAGFRGSDLFVARFLVNGTLDPDFGTSGVYSRSFPTGALQLPLRIVRAAGGGYRVLARHVGTASGGNGCSVRGLTAAGDVDAGFGASGVATLTGAGGAVVECSAIAVQSDGKLLLGGAGGGAPIGNGYLGRLLSNGAPDPGFTADAAAMAQLLQVTAIATGPGGAVYVGGFARNGEYGARVMRLQPDGALDPSYGRGGIARIDLQAPRPSVASVEDLQVLSDGRVVAGGNFSTDYWATTAFVARLLGAAGSSPGVLGMTEYRFVAPEKDGRATLKVQRTGGRSGPVAVTYTARAVDPPSAAAAGGDFTAVSGQLTWADGDDGEREIVVPLVTDSTSESPERFEVVLTAPEGGAGLGAAGAEVEIADLGYPAGIFVLYPSSTLAAEGDTATFYVSRDSYAQGSVSVTLRVRNTGTAELGKDFILSGGTADGNDIVLTWADGQAGAKPVTVRLVSDSRDEGEETIAVELTSPTGGAALGEPRQTSMRIQDTNGPPAGGGGGGGGGGTWGGLGALLLGLAGLARRWRPRLR